MKYDRPEPTVIMRGIRTLRVSWGDIFAGNAPAPGSSLDEAIELLRAFVDGEVSAHTTRGVGRTLLRELGVIA
jgi:hypothetical protein